jgi:hypothetical protein
VPEVGETSAVYCAIGPKRVHHALAVEDPWRSKVGDSGGGASTLGVGCDQSGGSRAGGGRLKESFALSSVSSCDGCGCGQSSGINTEGGPLKGRLLCPSCNGCRCDQLGGRSTACSRFERTYSSSPVPSS